MLAIIVGSKGQDGILLSNYLSEKNYEIIEIDLLYIKPAIVSGIDKIDISKYEDISRLIKTTKPDEIYYLAAYHHSSEDILEDEIELYNKSYNVNVFSYLNFLEAIRVHSPTSRIFYASSSHIFGDTNEKIQNEDTIANPISLYSITKYNAMQLTYYYRLINNIFCSIGILYTHESPYRSEKFVSKKIVETAVDIKMGEKNQLKIGDLQAKIDWGYAGDYVIAFNKILNHNIPDDFIVSSGEMHSIRDFINYVFNYLELDWKKYIIEDETIIQRKSNNNLFGDYKKLNRKTGWIPKTDLKSLAILLVDASLSKNKLSIK